MILTDLPAFARFGIFLSGAILVTVVVKVLVAFACRLIDLATEKLASERNLRRRNRLIQSLVRFLGVIILFAAWIWVVSLSFQLIGVNPVHTVAAAGIVLLIMTLLFGELVINLVRGFEILTGRYYLVGDFVEVSGIKGFVIDFTMSRTRLRTAQGDEVNLPNSRCVPARRYPRSHIPCYLDIVLAEPKQFETAQRMLQLAGRDLNDTNEYVRHLPEIAVVISRHLDHRPVIRWKIEVLPGFEESVCRQAKTFISRVLADAQIKLMDELNCFCLNNLRTFRRLFSHELNEFEVQEALQKEQKILQQKGE